MAERAAKQLELNKSELPNSITEVIATLSRAGFDAYIVGGGVRDTLLGLRPKDFDAVTDAKPHEIKDVFGKRCRIIGRRFQLAHVYSGRELIEVATFRGPPTNDANTNQDGMIIRDNVWGDIKQDFARRDFSINALYYQPLKGIVHDFCGALSDIRNKTIRLLGNAPTRIEEDPVRLLRALRFKAKLGFEFDDELAEQFHDGNWALLEQISPHRLYDETQKMFTGGYLVPLLPLLFESGAIDSLIIYPPSEPNALVKQVAINTDKRINAGKSINPAFFYAALLWENYLHQLEKAKKRNMPFAEAQMQAASKVIERQRIKTAIPKFAEQFIRDIWVLQPKLAAPRSKQIEQLSEHPRFRAGFDFLLLREQCGDAEHPLSESTNEMGDWWQTYQTLSEAQKRQAIDDFDESIRRGAYKREKNAQRGRGRNRQKQVDTDDEHVNQPIINDTSNVPARRRRAAHSSQTQPNNPSPVNSSRQMTQDHHELALLQQLSLANNKSSYNKASKPAPLFVIEHKNVVPPLQTQQAAKKPSTQVSNEAKKVPQDKEQAPKADRAIDGDHQQGSSKVIKAEQTTDKRASKPQAAIVPQTPQLVINNSEPIPHQRRRRQPSVVLSVVLVASDDKKPTKGRSSANKTELKAKVDKNPTSAKATDTHKNIDASNSDKVSESSKSSKSSKSKAKATNISVESNTNKAGKAITMTTTNKGAVPAKRRRRQPSVDTTVIEQQGE